MLTECDIRLHPTSYHDLLRFAKRARARVARVGKEINVCLSRCEVRVTRPNVGETSSAPLLGGNEGVWLGPLRRTPANGEVFTEDLLQKLIATLNKLTTVSHAKHLPRCRN